MLADAAPDAWDRWIDNHCRERPPTEEVRAAIAAFVAAIKADLAADPPTALTWDGCVRRRGGRIERLTPAVAGGGFRPVPATPVGPVRADDAEWPHAYSV